jgi:hypothetical protein
MKTRRSYALAGSLGVTLAFSLVLAVGLLSTGSEAVAEGESEGATAGEAAPGQADGQVEGIKVHGHWTIEVRDPDGSLVERQEFDNALDPAGNGILTRILGRVQSVGNWQVWTRSPTSSVCQTAGTGAIECYIVESGDPDTGDNYFATLSVSVPGSAPFSLNLSGYLTAQQDGTIESVAAVVKTCGGGVAPTACVGASVPPLEATTWVTATTLPAPVAALTGQQVLVNVVISFS